MYNRYVEKNELIQQVALKSGLKEADVSQILDAFTLSIKEGLRRGEKVTIAGFGTFSLSLRKAQTFKNPKTSQIHEIPERVVPHFKAGRTLANSVLGK